jgi:hypothetical protein
MYPGGHYHHGKKKWKGGKYKGRKHKGFGGFGRRFKW